MQENTIWEGRSSPLLYLYEYVVVIAAASFVHRHFGGHLYLFALCVVAYFTVKARSMRYAMSPSEIYFSPSIGEGEAMTVRLNEILEIQVVDRKPWSFFGLGTVILLTDPDEELQPCMKCLKDPRKLAEQIRRTAVAAGAERFDIEVVN